MHEYMTQLILKGGDLEKEQELAKDYADFKENHDEDWQWEEDGDNDELLEDDDEYMDDDDDYPYPDLDDDDFDVDDI